MSPKASASGEFTLPKISYEEKKRILTKVSLGKLNKTKLLA